MANIKIHKNKLVLLLCFFSSTAISGEAVKLNLKGKISQKCSIYHMSDLIDLSRRETKTVAFKFYCNSPFDISVTSQNGGLKNGNYLVRYHYALDIPKAGISIHGDSEKSVMNAKIVNVEKIPFDSRGEIKVSLMDQLEISGHYQEILRINLYPKRFL
ncbi:hypothetical protein [Photobacterium galatheae]|uniref:Spore coat protein U domain-containing protein n=1 Tax=Photobacterium galatheae TaxID=1654360 RepID=A0A066RTN3_9GAMM|nr:hypothetical protein [Photobacterium galatheae]KDM91062.1 hypothetical protein EA58_12965 [Photobacterium galatheae]MCM0150218.1 hypothetical protein [Photobacterium galatheae]